MVCVRGGILRKSEMIAEINDSVIAGLAIDDCCYISYYFHKIRGFGIQFPHYQKFLYIIKCFTIGSTCRFK